MAAAPPIAYERVSTKGRLMPETPRSPTSGTTHAVGGVYALLTRAGDHRYIGRTANLERRGGVGLMVRVIDPRTRGR
jgi:hypothetical protein